MESLSIGGNSDKYEFLKFEIVEPIGFRAFIEKIENKKEKNENRKKRVAFIFWYSR